MSIGSEVREWRGAAGLSIRALAERAGIAASTVWRIEAGRLDPTTAMVARLRAATDRARPANGGVTREASVSVALGRATAVELLRDPPRVLRRARRRVARMLASPDLTRSARRGLGEWARLLDGPLEDVVAVLIDPSERGYELRQVTPFTGVIDDDVRLRVVRQASREHRATRSA